MERCAAERGSARRDASPPRGRRAGGSGTRGACGTHGREPRVRPMGARERTRRIGLSGTQAGDGRRRAVRFGRHDLRAHVSVRRRGAARGASEDHAGRRETLQQRHGEEGRGLPARRSEGGRSTRDDRRGLCDRALGAHGDGRSVRALRLLRCGGDPVDCPLSARRTSKRARADLRGRRLEDRATDARLARGGIRLPGRAAVRCRADPDRGEEDVVHGRRAPPRRRQRRGLRRGDVR
ncbi:Uncharacterised protein [Burkholderia pseudomallei]|nr:Uncharacterised protein [Burkholderia pseudomallei]